MTLPRLSRWILLLGALLGCMIWAYIAIDHLLDYSMSDRERVAEYNLTPQPPSAHLHQMDVAQQHWGRQSMFAVACSFGLLLAVGMNWVLDGRPRLDERLQQSTGGEAK